MDGGGGGLGLGSHNGQCWQHFTPDQFSHSPASPALLAGLEMPSIADSNILLHNLTLDE